MSVGSLRKLGRMLLPAGAGFACGLLVFWSRARAWEHERAELRDHLLADQQRIVSVKAIAAHEVLVGNGPAWADQQLNSLVYLAEVIMTETPDSSTKRHMLCAVRELYRERADVPSRGVQLAEAIGKLDVCENYVPQWWY